jgi:hypothetical protein
MNTGEGLSHCGDQLVVIHDWPAGTVSTWQVRERFIIVVHCPLLEWFWVHTNGKAGFGETETAL